ncbi:MAG: DUF6544 family protein [Chloroflexota bacterium]
MFTLRPFPSYPVSTPPLQSQTMPANLPSPVAHFFARIAGEQIPIIHSAVISGTGKLRFKGVTFQARWRFTHCAGESYRHYIEAALGGVSVLKVNECYLDGEAHFELPFAVVEHSAKLNMSANLALWAESIWLPSIWLTDPRVHWEGLDEHQARLIIPFGEDEDGFTATFDPQTRLLAHLETMRYRDVSDEEKLGWRNDIQSWKCFHGIEIPATATVTWADQAKPWLVLSVEEIVYNIDVSQYLRMKGI